MAISLSYITPLSHLLSHTPLSLTSALRVQVHYVGTLADSKEVFDSTRARGKPVAFVYGGKPFGGVNAGLMVRTKGSLDAYGSHTGPKAAAPWRVATP